MSHFIGLVFVNTDNNDLDYMLEPYNEQSNTFCEFEDCTEEIQQKFDSLPDKDERITEDGKPWPYPCDKEHYPTFESLADDWYGYRKNKDGIYGYTYNPDAKWDWYSIGNRWDGYILGKDGEEHNELPFNEVDWEKMFAPVEKTYTDFDGEEKSYLDTHIPFCLVTTEGEWYERGEMGWWAVVSNEKPEDEWGEEVKSYVKMISELPEEERNAIVVYAVDFHI